MCTTTLNSLFFDENFVTEDLNCLPWPITLCNAEGVVLYKNRCAYQRKQFRVRSGTKKIIREPFRGDYLCALSRHEIKMFECDLESGFSYAVTAPFPDGNVAVLWVVSTFLYLSLSEAKKYDDELICYRNSDRLIRLYIDACKKLNTVPREAEEALINNSLRFSRASRHFALYTKVMMKTADREADSFLSLNDLCGGISEYFAGHIATLGYRMSFTAEMKFAFAVVPKNLFVCTYLQILSIALRMAADYSVRVRLSEFDRYYHLQYSFKCSELLPLIKTATVAELEFLKVVCQNSGWQFSEPRRIGPDEAMCSFSIPVRKNEKPTMCRETHELMREFFEMAKEEASILPRVFFPASAPDNGDK